MPNSKYLSEHQSQYRIAYDEAVRTLEDQVSQLNDMRQRIVSYLAFIGTATAFLVGASVGRVGDAAVNRDGSFYALASTGTVALAATLLAALGVLWPGTARIQSTSSARRIIYENIERQVEPIHNEAHLLRELAEAYDEAAETNDSDLNRVRGLYFTAVAVGAAQLGVWITLIWTHI